MQHISKDEPFEGQIFKKLRRRCLSIKQLFTDDEFPPTGKSLFFSCLAPGDVEWKRPTPFQSPLYILKEIVHDPKFFIDKASADDFAQGSLGNCWFVAACACIAENTDLWKKVVPDYKTQEFSPTSRYAGIFHFKFWRCGSWVDVVIDDYLPTRKGCLIYTHSKSKNQFWAALLEKAYAKLFGSYEALTSGKARDAMVDLTGGVGELLKVVDFSSGKLFDILHKAKADSSPMCPCIEVSATNKVGSKLSVGLVRGHAYSITDVRMVPLKGTGHFHLFNREKIKMIRLRDPWGGAQWTGPWSDGSSEWETVSESEKKDMGLHGMKDGEFWMVFEDFCRYFSEIDVCHMVNTSLFSLKKTWHESWYHGQWSKADHTVGGCGNHDGFLKNPQYLLDVHEDEGDILVSLEQKDQRSSNSKTREGNLYIGVTVMKTDLNREYRMHDRMGCVHTGPFLRARSVFKRLELKRGRYCLIPSTHEPNVEGRYLLRVYSLNKLTIREMLKDKPGPPRFFKQPKVAATSVQVQKAEKFPVADGDTGIDTFCIIKCEGQKVQTSVQARSMQPVWKERATFYRTKPAEDIVIELWRANRFQDSLIGTLTLPMANAHEYTGGNTITNYQLTRATLKSKEECGQIWLWVKHTENLLDI